jgi:hypothetical protein
MRPNVLNLLLGGAGALVLSAPARALPEPAAFGSRFYACFYQLAHLVLANFDKVQIENDIQSSSH